MKTEESKKPTRKDKAPGVKKDNAGREVLPQFKTTRFYQFFVMLDGICDMFDDWRLIPRAVIVLYSMVFWKVVEWYMAIPDPTSEQTAFVSAIAGVAAAFFGIYTNGGGRNNDFRE